MGRAVKLELLGEDTREEQPDVGVAAAMERRGWIRQRIKRENRWAGDGWVVAREGTLGSISKKAHRKRSRFGERQEANWALLNLRGAVGMASGQDLGEHPEHTPAARRFGWHGPALSS